MARKKPLVEDARNGLNALRNHVFQQIQRPSDSYREKFRNLARERVAVMNRPQDDPDSKPGPNR